MIGLEYICKLYGLEYKDIASLLRISKQVVTSWIKKRRNIPKTHLLILGIYFNTPEEYIQKELTDMDKIKIQEIKLIHEYKRLGYYNETSIIKKLKRKVQKYVERDYKAKQSQLDWDCEEHELYKSIEKTLYINKTNINNDFDEVGASRYNNLDLYKRFINIIINGKIRNEVFENILKGVEKYQDNNIGVNEFSESICNLIKYEEDRLNKEDRCLEKINEFIYFNK